MTVQWRAASSITPFALSTVWGLAWTGTPRNEFVAVGEHANVAGHAAVATSSTGDTWTAQAAVTIPYPYSLHDVAYSPSLDRLVAVGTTNFVVPGTGKVFTSDDGGVTWTDRGNPLALQGYSVAWSATLNLFVATGSGAGAGVKFVASSADGITWTLQTTPWDGGGGRGAARWIDGVGGQFLIAGWNSTRTKFLLQSSDGITWADVTTPIPTGGSITVNTVMRSANLGVVIVGYDVASSAPAEAYITSPDLVTWSGPFAYVTVIDGPDGFSGVDCDGIVLLSPGETRDAVAYTFNASQGSLQVRTHAIAYSDVVDTAVCGGVRGFSTDGTLSLTVPEVDDPVVSDALCRHATFDANITPNTLKVGGTVTWEIQYADNIGFAGATTVAGGTVSGLDPVAVSLSVGSVFVSGTTYYVRLMMWNTANPTVIVESSTTSWVEDPCPGPTLHGEFELSAA